MADTTTIVSAVSPTKFLVPGVTNGVAVNAPPLEMMPSIKSAIDKACLEIPADKHVAVVGIITDKDGEKRANGAIVARVGDRFKVAGWLGKSWGTTNSKEIGAAVSLVL